MALGLFAVDAQADHRKKYRRAIAHDRYYAGPQFVRRVPGLRVFFGDYAMTEDEFNELYGIDGDFDESYYEPEPVAPVKPVQKKRLTKKATPLTTASIKKPVSKPKSIAASSTLPCDKATTIVSGYGFTAVKPETCKGKTYAFNATRGGKSFTVKVDAASGELTEVKKLQ